MTATLEGPPDVVTYTPRKVKPRRIVCPCGNTMKTSGMWHETACYECGTWFDMHGQLMEDPD